MKKTISILTVLSILLLSQAAFPEGPFDKDEGTGWNEYVNDDGSITQMDDMGEGQYMDADLSEKQLDQGPDGGDFITNDGAPLQEEEI